MTAQKPNLLFVFADQWRRQAVGFMKEDPVLTPNIDNFAKESLVFDNATSSCPLCSPHRAALFTGKYPLSTGVFTNCKPDLEIMLKPEEICIGDVLKEKGYNTGYIGKWHLDVPEVRYDENPVSGASNWDAFTPPGPKRHGFDFWYSYGAFDKHLAPHYWRDTSEMIKINKWSVEHETDVAIDYIKSCGKDKPFALFLSINPPHSPYDEVPEKYKAIYRDMDIKLRPNVIVEDVKCHTGEVMKSGKDNIIEAAKNYFAAITGIDENFGRLIDELKRKGLYENTIIVLSADHGDMMGSHGMMAKHVWYEESIGIPYIMRWPQKIKSGRTDALLNSMDVMPTLLGLMGFSVPDSVEGTDFSKVLTENQEDRVTSAFISAYPGRDIFVKAFSEKGANILEYGWRGVKTKKYTYVINKGYFPEDNELERLLFDNESDPYQLNPIKIQNPKENPIACELENELKKHIHKINDPFKIEEVE